MGDTNSTKSQHEQPNDPFTCEICIEPMLSNKKKFQNDNLCVHPFCNESITKYVQSKNEEERVAGIKCPGSNCDKLLDPLTCPTLVPPKVSDRCYCPNRDKLLDPLTYPALVPPEVSDRCYCPNHDKLLNALTWPALVPPVGRCYWCYCPNRDKCRCGRSFSCECGRKVHQHQCCYCKDKANNEDTTKKEKHTADINKEQVVPHQCYCKDKANNEDTTKKKNPSLCPLISFCIVFVVLFYLFAAFINRKH